MTRESWIAIAQWAGQLIVVVIGAWATAWFTVKYTRTAPTPAEKPPTKTQLFIRRIGNFIKRNWPDLVIVPLTYVWPIWSFVTDLSRPADDVRVVIMRVALDVLMIAILSAFWISLYVSYAFATTRIRAKQLHESEKKP